MSAQTVYLESPDAETFRDLSTFASRAKRLDDAGAVRLSVTGAVLAVTVAPLSAVDRAPTVLGMRITQLADRTADGLDVVVGLAAMTDRFARGTPADLRLPVPPTTVEAAWADDPPPRGGWQLVAHVECDVLMAEADANRSALPGDPGSDGPTRRFAGEPGETPVLVGSAVVADGLGFLQAGETADVFRSGPWQRIATRRGHVVTRLDS